MRALASIAVLACVLAPSSVMSDWLDLASAVKEYKPAPVPVSTMAPLKKVAVTTPVFTYVDPKAKGGLTAPPSDFTPRLVMWQPPAPISVQINQLVQTIPGLDLGQNPPVQTVKTPQTNETPPLNEHLLASTSLSGGLPETTGLAPNSVGHPSSENNGVVKVETSSQGTAQPGNQKLISNVFAGTDIREAFSEIASTANVTIIPDDTIKTTLVYMEFKNEPVESAITKLALLSGAYVKKQADGVYLVSQGTPDAGLFREFSVTTNYRPQNVSGMTLVALLPKNYKPYVQADDKSNLVAITAPAELTPKILSDMQKIDSPVRQFVVEALITELNETNGKDFGFSWSWKNFAQGSDLSLTYTQAATSDIATLKALITKGTATIRANPRVTAFEGRSSTMTIGQETYFSILTGNVNFPTAQIQLIKTGVTLTFTGYIAEDGTITLDLSPEVSDAIVSVNGNPTTNVRRVSTVVRVKPGETIAIGGLIEETTSRETDRIPILGYLPIVGELFTNRTNSAKRTEDIILITPYLTDQGAGMKGIDSNRKVPGS